MKELKTEILLKASPEQVWEVLTDFSAYSEWNPFIVKVEGEGELGGRLANTMFMNGKDMVFKPVITRWEPGQVFEWLGSGMMGMFNGRHYFLLEEAPEGHTLLIHGEKFSGLLSGLVLRFIGDETLKSFLAMNRALAQRLESMSVGHNA